MNIWELYETWKNWWTLWATQALNSACQVACPSPPFPKCLHSSRRIISPASAIACNAQPDTGSPRLRPPGPMGSAVRFIAAAGCRGRWACRFHSPASERLAVSAPPSQDHVPSDLRALRITPWPSEPVSRTSQFDIPRRSDHVHPTALRDSWWPWVCNWATALATRTKWLDGGPAGREETVCNAVRIVRRRQSGLELGRLPTLNSSTLLLPQPCCSAGLVPGSPSVLPHLPRQQLPVLTRHSCKAWVYCLLFQ